MPRATRFMKPRYLTKDDVAAMSPKDRTFEVDHVSVEVIARDERLVLYSDGLPYPLPLNSTNIEQVVDITKAEDTDDWRGHKLEVYIDESVTYGERRVGGIRLRAPK